jgi:hypothetical protein
MIVFGKIFVNEEYERPMAGFIRASVPFCTIKMALTPLSFKIYCLIVLKFFSSYFLPLVSPNPGVSRIFIEYFPIFAL